MTEYEKIVLALYTSEGSESLTVRDLRKLAADLLLALSDCDHDDDDDVPDAIVVPSDSEPHPYFTWFPKVSDSGTLVCPFGSLISDSIEAATKYLKEGGFTGEMSFYKLKQQYRLSIKGWQEGIFYLEGDNDIEVEPWKTVLI